MMRLPFLAIVFIAGLLGALGWHAWRGAPPGDLALDPQQAQPQAEPEADAAPASVAPAAPARPSSPAERAPAASVARAPLDLEALRERQRLAYGTPEDAARAADDEAAAAAPATVPETAEPDAADPMVAAPDATAQGDAAQDTAQDAAAQSDPARDTAQLAMDQDAAEQGVAERELAARDPADPAVADPEPAPPATAESDPAVDEAPAQSAAVADSARSEPAAGSGEEAAPSFDIVRVDRSGRAVIAGRAAPGARVELWSDDSKLDTVEADSRGAWVSIPTTQLAPGARKLRLSAPGDEDARDSEQVVVIAVPEPASAEDVVDEAKMAPETPVAVLFDAGQAGGKLLQAPGLIRGEGALTLAMVGYDEQGAIHLSGQAPPDVTIRLYVDNAAAATARSDAQGAWAAGLVQPLAPGDYMLRLDQIDAAGATVARLETPFSRVARLPDGEVTVDRVVVQPGNSLWRIAHRLFGDGFSYVHIYEANKAQIQDPDLIYPGQIFEVPAELEEAG